jgi:hypothetical protein
MHGTRMDRRIDAHIARTQFGQIMDLATKNNERFIVDRRGEPPLSSSACRISSAPPRRRPTGCRKPGAAPNGAGSTPWPARYRRRNYRASAQEGPHQFRRVEVIQAMIETNVQQA